ncbi:hypothetical protein PG993_007916 [Apiospora rasikravindrae]|uniref:Uncharacterized protein n=1 Tax=Apiospora rasikravindrae TaxID=990691 RepID=A0ABR1SYV7_9PEZI
MSFDIFTNDLSPEFEAGRLAVRALLEEHDLTLRQNTAYKALKDDAVAAVREKLMETFRLAHIGPTLKAYLNHTKSLQPVEIDHTVAMDEVMAENVSSGYSAYHEKQISAAYDPFIVKKHILQSFRKLALENQANV